MAITLSPSAILPAAPPASRSADPTAETTDNGFAALFALVAMPTLVDAPPAPETGTGVGEAPDDTATPAAATQDKSRTAPTAPWEAAATTGAATVGDPTPIEPLPPQKEATATHLPTGEISPEEAAVRTATAAEEAIDDLTAKTAPPPNGAPPTTEPTTITATGFTLRDAPATTSPDASAPSAKTDTDIAGAAPAHGGGTSSTTPPPAAEAAEPAAISPAVATTATLASTIPAATRTGEPTGRSHREESAAPSAAITTEPAAAARPDPPTAVPPTAAILPSRIAAVVADHIRQSGPGRHRLEITLHPPELGRVEVHMVVGHDTVQAHLIAQSEAGRDALAHHLPALREQLAAHGFTDAQVGVDLSGRGGEQRSHRQPAFAGHPASAAAEETAVATPHRPSAVRRLLDRRA